MRIEIKLVVSTLILESRVGVWVRMGVGNQTGIFELNENTHSQISKFLICPN